MHIRHVTQWEFKQGDSDKVTFDKICSIFGEGRITDLIVRKWFAKFASGNIALNGELRVRGPSEFDDSFLKAILQQNPRQARDIAKRMYRSKSTVCRHLEKLGKVFKLGIWVLTVSAKEIKKIAWQ